MHPLRVSEGFLVLPRWSLAGSGHACHPGCTVHADSQYEEEPIPAVSSWRHPAVSSFVLARLPPPAPPTSNCGAARTHPADCGLGLTGPPRAPRRNLTPAGAPPRSHLWRIQHLLPIRYGPDQADGAAVHWRQGATFSGAGCRQAGDHGQGRWQGRCHAPLPALHGRPAGHPQVQALWGAAHQQAPLPASCARKRTRLHQRTALSSVGCSGPSVGGGGLPVRPLSGSTTVSYSRKACHSNVQGHPTCSPHPR